MSEQALEKTGRDHRLSLALCRAFYIVSAVLLGLVTYVALFSTTIYMGEKSEAPTVRYFLSDAWLLPALGILGGIVVVVILCLACRKLDEVSGKPLFIAVLCVTALLGLWWVLIQDVDTSRFGDSNRLLQFAKDAAAGNWGWFTDSSSISAVSQLPDDAHLYFMEYPFQAGIFYWFYAFYCFFGSSAVRALLVANVVADEVVIAAVYGIARLLRREGSRSGVALVLLLLCVPLHFSAAFPYGNNVGLALGVIFLFIQCKALCEEDVRLRVLLILASLVPLTLTLWIKSTFLLLAIAAVIAWLLTAIRSKNPLGLACAVVVLLVSNSLSAVPVQALEAQAGYSFGEGMPKTSWLMLGSNRSELTGAAGWWDAQAVEVFLESEGDKDAQTSASISAIKDNLAQFVADPVGAIGFYAEKLSTEWADPTFEFFVYAGLNAKDFEHFFDPYEVFGTHPPAATIVAVLDALQIATYVLALFGLIALARSKDPFGPELLLATTFFTGFGCYLLWEAKGIYLLPFYVFLIPLASMGASSVRTFIEERLIHAR